MHGTGGTDGPWQCLPLRRITMGHVMERDGTCSLPLSPRGEATAGGWQPVLGEGVYVSALTATTMT